MILTADAVITPGATLRPGWVRVTDETIVDVGEGTPPTGAEQVTHLGAVSLVPGFVDQHCHGGGGVAFTEGREATARATAAHRDHGTTSLVASLVTDTPARLQAQIAELAPLVEVGDILGVHLEGPWLSSVHCGAHSPELLRVPDPDEVDEILSYREGVVVMVTLASELEGGEAAVEVIARHGALPALGHSDATYAEARRAISAGANVATHLFNAERPFHHREPGLVAALMEDDGVVVELIADGVHVHPAALRTAIRASGGRFVLVTDAMAAAGNPDGAYTLGPLDVTVESGVARLADGTIAGSTLTMDAAVRYVVHECGVDLHEAMQAAATRPADLLGRPELGRIAPGARADLVTLDGDLEVSGVMHRGRWWKTPATA